MIAGCAATSVSTINIPRLDHLPNLVESGIVKVVRFRVGPAGDIADAGIEFQTIGHHGVADDGGVHAAMRSASCGSAI